MNYRGRGAEVADVNQDRNVRVNWGTINVPTIFTTVAAAIGIIVAVFTAVSSFSAGLERIDARLDILEDRVDNIETIRQARLDEVNKRFGDIHTQIGSVTIELKDITSSIKQLEYRVTVGEQGLTAANARMDRFSDVISQIRESLGKLDASILLLTQKLEAAFPGDVRRGN